MKQSQRDLGPVSKEVLNQASRMGVPTRDQERALIVRCAAGDKDAINELAIRNARLICSFISKYSSDKTPADDVFQAGIMGLIRAAEKSDVQKWDEQFSRMSANRVSKIPPSPYCSYALHWIRAMMTKTMFNYESQVHRGPKQYPSKSKPKLAAMQAAAQHGPSVDEVQGYQSRGKEYSHTLPAEKRAYIAVVNSALSEMPPDLDTSLDSDSVLSVARRVLSRREYDIIVKMMGFGREEPMTYEQLGRKWMLSKQRIHQIRVGAIEKIRKELGHEVSVMS